MLASFLSSINTYFSKFSCYIQQSQKVIYILKLFEDKWYIGKTNNLQKRLKSHYEGRGSEFTKIYKVEKLYNYFEMKSIFDEDNTVKEYMIKYGIDNVRGGSYSNVILEPETKVFLQREIYQARDLCFKCGSSSHFASKCLNSKIDKKCNEEYENYRIDFGMHKGKKINEIPADYISYLRKQPKPSSYAVRLLNIINSKDT